MATLFDFLRSGSQYSSATQSALSSTPQNAPAFTFGDSLAPGQSPENLVNQADLGSNVLAYPLSDFPPYYISLGIAKYQRQSWASVGTLSPEKYVALPLPEQLVDAQTTTYNLQEIGLAGAAGMGIGSVIAGTNSVSEIAQAVNNNKAGIAASVGVAAADVAAGSIVGAAARAGLQAAGVTINDFLTVLLKGPAYKEYAFTWKLSPRSADESRALQNLIVALKNAQAPGYSATLGSMFFSWPRLFQIEFRHFSTNMGERLYRFKPAVLARGVFDYTPQGVPSFYATTKAPESVRITLHFMEVELWVNSSPDAQDAYPGKSFS